MIQKINNLKKKAKELRRLILSSVLQSGGHLSTSLSCVEILISIYFGNIININKKNVNDLKRNKFILSKGHAATALYCILYMLKLISKKTLFVDNNKGQNKLGSHVDHRVEGVELTTGSLGHGLGYACGLSFAAKKNKFKSLNVVLLGDAECSEGSIWEACLFASFHKLNNLIAIIDNNNIGSLDYNKNFTSLNNLSKKFISFGWHVQTVNGHSIREILTAFNKCHNAKKPSVIIAKTIKGKGISIIENDPIWHSKTLTKLEEINLAKKEIFRA